MSMHNKPLTPLELAGLEAHGLDIGTPSQLSDAFRHGVAFALTPKLEQFNFDLTHALPRWHLEPTYAHEVTVEFDGAEGGAVWVQSDDESIAIRGPEAMRELARMLNAFADGYTGPMEAAQ